VAFSPGPLGCTDILKLGPLKVNVCMFGLSIVCDVLKCKCDAQFIFPTATYF
jgi:hypothetical protein